VAARGHAGRDRFRAVDPCRGLGHGPDRSRCSDHGLFIGPLFGLLPAFLIGGFVQLRYMSRWKKELREVNRVA
jgi:hypothetical protein